MCAYVANAHKQFGGLHSILLDNGSVFNNKLFMPSASTLEIRQIYSLPYYPLGKGSIIGYTISSRDVYQNMSPQNEHGIK